MPHIIVERQEGSLLDRLRAYHLIVDGTWRGSIRQRETWSFSVEAGLHNVAFRIGYATTPPVKVMVESRVRLICRPSLGAAFGMAGSQPLMRVVEEDDTLEAGPDPRAHAPRPSAQAPPAPARAARWGRRRAQHGAVLLAAAGGSEAQAARGWLALDLKSAIENDAIEPCYRPQVALADARVTAVRASAVWRHSRHGVLDAAAFVPLAQEFGVLGTLARRLLRRITRDLAGFPPGLPIILDLHDFPLLPGATVPLLATALAEAGLRADRLMLRVPEAAALDSDPARRLVLEGLRTMGCRTMVAGLTPMPRGAEQKRALRLDAAELGNAMLTALAAETDGEGPAHELLSLFRIQDMAVIGGDVASADQIPLLRRAGVTEAAGPLFGEALDAAGMRAWLAQAGAAGPAPTAAAGALPLDFARIVDNLREAVVVTDTAPNEPGPRILYVNPAFCRLTGYAREEALGRSPRMLQGALTEPAARAEARAAIENETPALIRMTNYTKAGAPFTCELRLVPVRDAAQGLTHFAGVMRDVTHETPAEAIAVQAIERDVATGLRNRRGFLRAVAALTEAAAAPHPPTVVLARFSLPGGALPDSATLYEAAGRIVAGCRHGDVLGYLGGGVFACCLQAAGRAQRAGFVDTLEAACRALRDARLDIGRVVHDGAETAGALLERAESELGAPAFG